MEEDEVWRIFEDEGVPDRIQDMHLPAMGVVIKSVGNAGSEWFARSFARDLKRLMDDE